MPQTSGGPRSGGGGDPAGDEDLPELRPLELIKAQVVPPAPNRRESAIDWLHNFRGFSWIAYGAGSLLVISHCPCPTSPEETQLGSFFKQVLEPPLRPPSAVSTAAAAGDGSAEVKAVAWCHSRPSKGEVAAGLGGCVGVYSPGAANARDSLCWRQIAVLVHSFTIEALEWTQSGDGLIVAGSEVVSWKRENLSWEISWKLKVSVAQTLVSATWSMNGPVATVAHFSAHSHMAEDKKNSSSQEASQRVLMFCRDDKFKVAKVELCHPQPVSMIQWRPYHVPLPKKDFIHSRRDVLLTCCLDGVVRLWSEIDGGRIKKSSKDISEQKAMRQSFHVIAIIEINQCLKGNIGTDVFMSWATENWCPLSKGKGVEHCFFIKDSQIDQVGHCEWLVGIGPGLSISFWSIHCLDDLFPLRFPRVNLWKKLNLTESREEYLSNLKISSFEVQPIIIKAIVWRNWLSGPPEGCSLIQLVLDNLVSWSHLCSPAVSSEDGSLSQARKDKTLSCFRGASLNEDSHTGRILKVAVHPCSGEVEIAVSLDSNGFLLFWSFSSLIGCITGTDVLADPLCQFVGKVSTKDLTSAIGCSTLSWAPSVLSDERFLLLGHEEGIDCILIKMSEEGSKKILCHKVFTIPFSDYNPRDAPYYITATPLASTCKRPFIFNSFMLLAIWMKEFQVLAWKIDMHSDGSDLSASTCTCLSDDVHSSMSKTWKYESYFSCRRYFVSVDLCSMEFPESHDCDKVTSISVLSPDKFYPCVQQMWVSSKHVHRTSSSYDIITGHSDGRVRLWRTPSLRMPSPHSGKGCLPWELVGMFIAHHGTVGGIALSSCASKIATVCKETSNGISNVHIWQFVSLLGGGSFLCEDKISLDGDIVALNWFAIGNGHSVLGLCLPNELHLYSTRRSCDLKLVTPGGPLDMQKWVCIARCHTYTTARDFVWGPRLTPVLIHERHLSVFSQYSFRRVRHHHRKLNDQLRFEKDYSPAAYVSETYEDFPYAICDNTRINIMKEPLEGENSETREFLQAELGNSSDDDNSCELLSFQNHVSYTKDRLCSIAEVVDKSCKLLPGYHPKVLLLHLFSGNWKRVYSIVRHLVGCLNCHDNRSQNSCLTIPEINLSDYFGEINTVASQNKGFQWGHDIAKEASTVQFRQNFFQLAEGNSWINFPESRSSSTSQKSEIMDFIDALKRSDSVRTMMDIDRTELLAIVDMLGVIIDQQNASAYESLDEPGRRFWVSVQFWCLHFLHKFGRPANVEETVVDSSMIAWAFQSDCQDNLASSLLSTEPSWMEMQSIGLGFWFINATQLRSRMEKLARLQYLKRKDPKDCMLLYIALNRLQVLAGLFKLSKEEKDKALVGFLGRNFQEEKNKLAALKNAYVLMGKHQLELAIAFFLLGGDPSSAVTVCAKNLGDEQLALVICRLIHGYGGPLEHQLILNVLLPNAVEKRDYWLVSLLEWALGNYPNSFKKLLDLDGDSITDNIAISSAAFLDPNISQYLVILASKNGIRHSVGDYMALVLSKWATSMYTLALNRSGLPLEALECLSSFFSTSESKKQYNTLVMERHEFSNGINPFSSDGCNWLVEDVAYDLEYSSRLNMATQYTLKLVMDHPSWTASGWVSAKDSNQLQKEKCDHNIYLGVSKKCDHNIYSGVSKFVDKYSIDTADIMNMVLLSADNHMKLLLGYHILHGYICQESVDDKNHMIEIFLGRPDLPKQLGNSMEEICYFLAKYALSCSFTSSASILGSGRRYSKDTCDQFCSAEFSLTNIINSMRAFRPILNLYGLEVPNDFISKTFGLLDLFEFIIHFILAWVQRDLKRLISLTCSILNALNNGESLLKGSKNNLVEFLYQSSESVVKTAPNDFQGHEQHESQASTMSEDERWHFIGVSLGRLLLNFSQHELSFLMLEPLGEEIDALELIQKFSFMFANLLIASLAFVSSSLTKCLRSFLMEKAETGLSVGTLVWLEQCKQSGNSALLPPQNHNITALQLTHDEDESSLLKMLWEISVDPKEILGCFTNEEVNDFLFGDQKYALCWHDLHESIMVEYAGGIDRDKEGIASSVAANNEEVSHSNGQAESRESFLEDRRKNSALSREVTYFHNPQEVHKRNGELLEAICFNSTDERQVALASNRKGLLYFNLKAKGVFKEEARCIWSDSDWPAGGWAGSESTPVPTFVSPGVGLGNRKGAHLGLGGATIGVGLLARPGRDLTGGGAFGIPGYAGIGASGLGWGEQEDFEEFNDPPATVVNIRTRALSSHPSKPLFLVGSSNTHVYLWEFGKDRATATYGVLPAANVPPPYALASISALQFDCCGQRFATAALDGTVCTWQLEVGGRSNVHPTDSSLCFNRHASAISYIAASGSILAAAGCSTNNVNVVVWDTLAPPTTSQASISCHEGGARSLSVFDNDIGIGSISPMIVTGGKNGDIGLHDFRYIATGKSKRHRHSNEQNLKAAGLHDANKFNENVDGMIWHVPRAHLGSVTKVLTIPNTSLILSGSKDGDVKLWDAKKCKLVCHWPKLHERHTFLQPSSRGFGGVVRAAVTDIQVLSHGFLTCGGDGSVRLVQLKDSAQRI